MKTILVVDDEQNIRQLYSETFKEEGYNVLLASTGAEGLELVSKNTVDLIILDIRLPDIDGLSVLEKLSRDSARKVPPVILNSAYSGYENNSNVWLAEKYLIKSGDLDELKNTVKNHQAHSAQARYLNSTPLGFAQAYPTFSLKTKYLDPLLYTLNYPGVSINNNGLVVF